MNKKTKHLALITLLLVLVGAGAFYGGMQYQKSQNQLRFAQFNGGGMMGGNNRNGNGVTNRRFGMQNGQGFTRGSVVSLDQDSLTVKLNDGSTKLINISDSTKYNKTVVGSKADLKSGENVMVIGKTNSDGSIDAADIHLGVNFPAAGPRQ